MERAQRLEPSDEALRERVAAWESKVQKRDKARWEDERRRTLYARDGPLTREQRVQRFQAVVGLCGMDNNCMRQLLGQDDDSGDEMVRF